MCRRLLPLPAMLLSWIITNNITTNKIPLCHASDKTSFRIMETWSFASGTSSKERRRRVHSRLPLWMLWQHPLDSPPCISRRASWHPNAKLCLKSRKVGTSNLRPNNRLTNKRLHAKSFSIGTGLGFEYTIKSACTLRWMMGRLGSCSASGVPST